MKKSYVGIFICLLCLMVLSGCCSHQWVEATCDAPKTCASCAETEGEALGHNWQEASCDSPKHCKTCGLTEGAALEHSWQEASCETPKTCTLCGSTEGEALGHSFTDWVFDEETMHRTCESCALEESQAIDREIYLRQQLEGYWACPNISNKKLSPHLNYREDSVSLFDGISSTGCELHFSGYDTDLDCYNALLVTTEGEEHLLCYAPGEEVPMTLTLANKQELSLMKNEYLDLVTGRTWAGYGAGTLYLVTFNPDGTVSGTIGTPTEDSAGAPVTGTWFAGVSKKVYGDFSFHVNLSGAEFPIKYPEISLYTYRVDTADYDHPSITMGTNNNIFSMEPIPEEAVELWLTAARKAETGLLGTWYSEIIYTYKDYRLQPKHDYTITFQENGTLTANFGYPIPGSWKLMRMELTNSPDVMPNIRYEIVLPPYDVLQISNGIVELYSHQTDTNLTFWRAEDRNAIRNQVAGNWVSTSISCYPASGGDAVERGDAEKYHITFTADGTICGNIGREIQDAYLILPGRNEQWQLQIPLSDTQHGVTVHVYENDTIAISYADSQYAYWIEFVRE